MRLALTRLARLPRSLRWQFTLATVVLTLLIATGGLTAVYTLRVTTNETRLLATGELTRMQAADTLVQHTLLIEREASRLASAGSLDAMRASYADILRQLETFDRLSDRLAAANDDLSVLDLHQASQLFRNTVNIVAQLRESELRAAIQPAPRAAAGQSGAGARAASRPPASRDTFSDRLSQQASAMVASAQLQSDRCTQEFQQAVQQLAGASARNERWITGLVAVSLLFAWLVAHAFLGKHVLARLEVVSSNLRSGEAAQEARAARVLTDRDEIGDMARAVEQFQQDRRELARAYAALREEKIRQEALIDELAQAHSQLLQSEKLASIGQLAAGVAHEINNPVGFVNANLGTLQRYVADLLTALAAYERTEAELIAESRATLAALKREIDIDYLRTDIPALLSESVEGLQRVKRIVQGLKDFSHVDKAEKQWANLESNLDTTIDVVWNELKYKAELEREFGAIPELECIPSQLNQVFMNLLMNAAQSIEGHGRITVRTGHDESTVWVEIEDTGQGIKPEHRDRIFDPFFTTRPVGTGAGLGLSISYGIVRKQGGRIEVRSQVGQGSTFRVILPKSPAEALTSSGV
ncbi:ATP-binding protein [Paraburkholderia phenoliruptrix]|uniref:ATP-binding protein n=1 Tax=Paraburkholderia phenoliruptrix TaxID=252970 RepID=UPI001C6E095C|nr:ATP-binding protein [Paraburkholderia phenoliruptrix]MBW9102138.1 sensor histidine kinase [Paraburkholderia phenoliruptrix]MBW9131249.1 sensor histidine kinase [Paraburkholderia ginsengiterrae]